MVRVWDASKDASQEPKAITEADLDILALDCGASRAVRFRSFCKSKLTCWIDG